jgi:hypothetical protein
MVWASPSSSSSNSSYFTIIDDGDPAPPQSLQETLERIQKDNDRSYFLSDQVDQGIYDPDYICLAIPKRQSLRGASP